MPISQEIRTGERDPLTGLISPNKLRSRVETHGYQEYTQPETGLGSIREQSRIPNRVD